MYRMAGEEAAIIAPKRMEHRRTCLDQFTGSNQLVQEV